MRDEVAVRTDQRFQQPELGGCECEQRVADARLVAAGVQRQVPGPESLAIPREPPTAALSTAA